MDQENVDFLRTSGFPNIIVIVVVAAAPATVFIIIIGSRNKCFTEVWITRPSIMLAVCVTTRPQWACHSLYIE